MHAPVVFANLMYAPFNNQNIIYRSANFVFLLKQTSEQREESCRIFVCLKHMCVWFDKILLYLFTVKKLEDSPLPSVVRVPKSYVSKPVMPMAPVSRGSVVTSVS